MSGMQDVATLAERYTNLSSTSHKLHRNIDRLKKETFDSHSVVQSRTIELERIHATSTMLSQLKQFVRAKAQLDVYLAGGDEKDIRGLSSAAKTVSELERLMQNPDLIAITLVNNCITDIKLFSKNIRILAQDRLLNAIKEKNQASIASSLQVFYNLDSLPEIILLVIDTTVKATIESSRQALDMDEISSLWNSCVENPAAGSAKTSTALSVPLSASKRNASATGMARNNSSGTNNPNNQVISLPQMRLALRELAHSWSSVIHEQAMRIHVFQRVVAKKEDPTTHEKFMSVLQRIGGINVNSHRQHTQQQRTYSMSNLSNGTTESNVNTNYYLSSGQLLELFWYRFSLSMQDVAMEKVRSYHGTAARAYPYIRRAAVEVLFNMKLWSEQDSVADNMASGGFLAASNLMLVHGTLNSSADMAGIDFDNYSEAGYTDECNAIPNTEGPASSASAFDFDGIGGGPNSAGVFGSLGWTQNDLLGSLGQHSTGSVLRRNKLVHLGDNSAVSPCLGSSVAMDEQQQNSHNAFYAQKQGQKQPQHDATSADHCLVQGLKPMRDKFLGNALTRMTAPILQMFPELEGYTAAIPSKRDLQALIKSVQSEFISALIESDRGLVILIGKEFHKTVKLMLSKIEGMIFVSTEATKISAHNNFARTNAQEHNGQLLVLLMQLKQALSKIPAQAFTASQETAAGLILTQNSTITSNSAKPTISSPGEVIVTGGRGGSAGTGNLMDTQSLAYKNQQHHQNQQQQAYVELQKAVAVTADWVNDLALRQILQSVVNLIDGYVVQILVGLHKEGVISGSSTLSTTAPAGGVNMVGANFATGRTQAAKQSTDLASSVECSIAVQTLIKQVPKLLEIHLFCLPKCDVVTVALEEIYVRTLHAYVSVSALLRPVNEALRLRTAKDMAALEAMLSGLCTIEDPHLCPVLREYKAYRRLLFQEDVASTTEEKSTENAPKKEEFITASNIKSPPNVTHWAQQPYISFLRPSTLLGYLISCGPVQLPSPYDIPNSNLQTYLEELCDLSVAVAKQEQQQQRNRQANSSTGTTVSSCHRSGNTLLQRSMASTIRLLYPVEGNEVDDWRKIPTESKAWEAMQQALDIFFQRIAVAEGAQKASMRDWYEAVLDLGSKVI